MPTGTLEYQDDAERVVIEQAIAFVRQMRDLAVTAPHGRVIDALEGHTLGTGRDLRPITLARGVQASVNAGEGKKGRTGCARVGTGGTARGGSSGP